MKSNLLSKENNVAKFTMDFTAEEFEQAVIKVYQETKGQFSIDGFRKGKAPRSIIERHYGEGVFFEDAINELFKSGYTDALKEFDLEVVDMPKAEFSEIAKGKPVTITLEVPLYPVVEVKDYKGVEIEEREADVTEDDVDVQLEMLQKRNSRLVVADRPVEDGDTVILDYAGFVGDEQFQGGTAENQQLVIGSGQFIPGFEEQLIGAKAGDKVDVKVTFPEEYHAEELAGKDAVFHCTVHEVKFEELPELDDEFVKDVSEFDTMEEFRKDTFDRLLESKELMIKNETKDALIEKISEANKVEVPKSMVDDEIDNMLRELEQQMMYQGMSVDMYMQFLGKDNEGFREDLRPEAEKRVVSRVVLRSIAAQEGLEVSDEDLEKEFARMAELYQMEVDKVKEIFAGDNLDYFKKDIIITKTIDFLYDNAKIKKVKPEVKKSKKDEE
ncbi:MAG: trigger factor [Firmicutes bacterium]|nr:trigger factor [Bacillota bacterium]